IYDLTGKLMMHVNLGASVNREINVAQLSRGVYMVKLSNNVNEFTKKLVIR
ncbi:MAG: T9SS type A sorting domain-containing protein, partial [Flavobacteriales bacterium]|nr:T9SS type A sorting domain-containing protein [Flavobacteriales bacterium]